MSLTTETYLVDSYACIAHNHTLSQVIYSFCVVSNGYSPATAVA